MLKNYLTIAFRNFLRYKLYSTINILGLAVGIAFCLLIYLFVQFEFSMDQFHEHKERIYRVENVSLWDGELKRSTILPCPLVPAMADEIPEIEKFSRYHGGGILFSLQGKKENETVHYVDPDFLDIFSFHLLKGDKKAALSNPKSIVISESIAQKYFGEEEPLGKTMYAQSLRSGEEKEFTVSAIIQDTPKNSSIKADILLNMDNSDCTPDNNQWPANFINGFILALPGASEENIIQKANQVYADHYPFDSKPTVSLTVLSDIYFDTETNSFGGTQMSNPQYSYILGSVALLILIIACINYVLLALTNSSSRTKEVGIRKVLGATKQTLGWQYLAEAQMMTFIALLLGITLAQLFLPAFNEFTQRELSLNLLENKRLILAIFGILCVTGLAAGSYPAYWLSRMLPVKILKGNTTYRVKSGLSNSLVMLQFGICIFFITCTLVMNRQLNFITNMDLGFDKDLIVKVNTRNYEQIDSKTIFDRFKNTLDREPRIEQVTAASTFPGFCCTLQFKYQDKDITTHIADVDYDFFPTLGIRIDQGRNFSRDIASDATKAVIINEALADELGYAHPVGEIFPYDSSVIIGLIKDVHINSLEQEIKPAFFKIGDPGILLIKINGKDIPATIEKLAETWKSVVSDQPMDYTFLDDEVTRMYEDYLRWQRIISLSTFFGVLIACMGLFGLSGLHAANKSKEIAIRKVMGAHAGGLLLLLNRRIFQIALLAFLFAVPFAYYAMSKWLENFAYRIELKWYWFGAACLAGVLITVFTVSYHTLKAALANPVKSLRYE